MPARRCVITTYASCCVAHCTGCGGGNVPALPSRNAVALKLPVMVPIPATTSWYVCVQLLMPG